MNKDRLEKLARWWDEASSQLETGDSEALKRKLHLMEAELRVALKAEPERSRRPSLAAGLAAMALVVVVIGVMAAVLLPREDGPVMLASRGGPEPTASIEAPVVPVTQPAIEAKVQTIAQAPQVRPQPERRIVAARTPRPPAERRTEPVVSTPTEPPATSPATTVPASAPAHEAEAPLDALALLVTLEREFEQ
jgi:hypothetical protein